MTNELPIGLDQRFLQFIGVTPESEREIHTRYLPLFQPGQKVIDLGCGAGHFLKMLQEQGVEAYGIDFDPAAVAEARAQGLTVFEGDAVTHMRQLRADSIDAIFSTHLVEHLDVALVYTIINETSRVLKPGGFLLLTTPNVKALISNVEMFWLHFDHKRFYHPRLLEFFMQDCGLERINYGENKGEAENSIRPNLSDPSGRVQWEQVLPPPKIFLLRPWWRFKQWLAHLIVLPYLVTFMRDSKIPFQSLESAFETYVIGYKPVTNNKTFGT